MLHYETGLGFISVGQRVYCERMHLLQWSISYFNKATPKTSPLGLVATAINWVYYCPHTKDTLAGVPTEYCTKSKEWERRDGQERLVCFKEDSKKTHSA